METKSQFVSWFAAIVAAMAIAGCATSLEAGHSQHHPNTTSAPSAGMMSSTAPEGQMAMIDRNDMHAMCDMHKKMMSPKTPEEQRAMMDERMKSMSPEMKKKHMAMMQECK